MNTNAMLSMSKPSLYSVYLKSYTTSSSLLTYRGRTAWTYKTAKKHMRDCVDMKMNKGMFGDVAHFAVIAAFRTIKKSAQFGLNPMWTIHRSSNYIVQVWSSGLLIEHREYPYPQTTTHDKSNYLIRTNHPDFAKYMDAFRTAIDSKEADALCKALLN